MKVETFKTPITEFFNSLTNTLKVIESKNSKLKTPPQYKTIKWGSFQWQEYEKGLHKAYKNVFGSSDIWGESAFCKKCRRKLDLNEYQERVSLRNFSCSVNSCDGVIVDYYPESYLKEKLQRELNSEDSSCTLYAQNEVIGFMWGQICLLTDICFNLYNTYYSEDFEKGSDASKKLLEMAGEVGLDALSNVFNAYELGIIKSFRGGIEPIVFLSRPSLELAHSKGIDKIFFKTHRKSPMWKIGILLGFIEFFRSPFEDETSYMYLPNLSSLLKLFQHFSIEEIQAAMKETNALFEKEKGLFMQT